MHVKMRNSQRSNVWAQYRQSSACSSLLNMHLNLKSARLIAVCKRTLKQSHGALYLAQLRNGGLIFY